MEDVHDCITESYTEDNPEDNTTVEMNQEKRLTIYRMIKTALMQHIWICMGLWASVVTPCIDALKDPIHSNYEQISRALAAKSVGIMLGSIGGGFIADKYRRWIDIQLGFSLLFCGLSNGLIPWCPNLTLMASAFFVNGIGQGSISAGGNSHALTMWGKDANGPFHYIHAGYGIGTILGPIIVAPFLPSTMRNSTHNTTTFDHKALYHPEILLHSISIPPVEKIFNFQGIGDNKMENNKSDNTTSVDVTIPFAISGGYSVLICFIFFIYAGFPFTKYEPVPSSDSHSRHMKNKKSLKEILSPGSCAGGNTVYALLMFTMIFFFYILLVGKDSSVITFAQPIAVSTPTLNFSLKEADILIMVFFICYTSGRIIISVVGKWLSVQVLVFVESIGLLSSLIALVLVGLNSKQNFWLTTCFFGLFTGPLFPSGMAWSDRYIKMTAIAFAVLDIGIGVGSFLFNWVFGYMLTKYPHNVLVIYYTGLGCAVVSLLLLILMQILGSIHGDRYKQIDQSDSNKANEETTDNNVHDTSPLVQ